MSPANSKPDRPATDFERERALKTLAILMSLGPIAVVVYLIRGSLGWGPFFSSLGTGIVVAGASLLVGGLLGFLFGIPRTLQQSGPLKRINPNKDAADPQTSGAGSSETSETASTGRDYEDNTNLEQISDWLTKILVGVGLIQIRTIGEKLYLLGGEVAGALGSPNGNRTFALSLIIFYLVIGFLFSYLWTRLILRGALRQADVLQSLANRVNQMDKKVDAVDKKADTGQSVAELGVGKKAAEPSKMLLEVSNQIKPGSGDDTWKGQFGGKSVNNGRRLSATVTPVPDRPDLFSILLSVQSTDPTNSPLSGVVQFFVHHTFTNQKPIVEVGPDGRAELRLVATGAFTVGALADDGDTKLELDLSELESAPAEFRIR